MILARVARALNFPHDLLRMLAELLPRIAPARLMGVTISLLKGLGFYEKGSAKQKEAAFEEIILRAISLNLKNKNIDNAIDMEGLAYEYYVKTEENEIHFQNSMEKISKPFKILSQQYIEKLPKLRQPPLDHPYVIGFFIHRASMLAHIEIMINTLKGYINSGEKLFTPIVYCFSDKNEKLNEALSEIGIKLVMIEDLEPGHRSSNWRKLLRLRKKLSEDGVHQLVWVSSVVMMPLAFGLRIAPVQTWWAMKYRNFALDEIDGYVTGSAIARFGWLHGRRWRMGMLGVDNWYSPELEPLSEGLRRPFGDKTILMTLGRTEKMQDPAYLQAVTSILKANPNTVFLWAGREENSIVKQTFEREGVASRTQFIGWVNTRLYAQVADIFLDTFPFPCGFTLFQAMAAGKPVVIYTSPEAAQTGLWSFLKPAFEGDDMDGDDREELHTFIGDRSAPLISIADTPMEYITLASRLVRDTRARTDSGASSARFMARYFSDPVVMGRSFAHHFVELMDEARQRENA